MAKLDKSKLAGLSQKKASPKTTENEQKSVGYTIGKQTANQKLKRTHVFLTPDIVSFVDDFAYEMKKKKGIRVTTSELTRIGLRLFQELPKKEQIELLMD